MRYDTPRPRSSGTLYVRPSQVLRLTIGSREATVPCQSQRRIHGTHVESRWLRMDGRAHMRVRTSISQLRLAVNLSIDARRSLRNRGLLAASSRTSAHHPSYPHIRAIRPSRHRGPFPANRTTPQHSYARPSRVNDSIAPKLDSSIEVHPAVKRRSSNVTVVYIETQVYI
ncbi:hypothetical protein OH77DRAFT_292484 [Trametes cingulata]|nr:hypothetical protein OH77DRAFT_292484 [Trametes cingulata]